jgi:hypothetical protein
MSSTACGLAKADYIDLSFRLFGDKISSLYYFYYLIMFVSGLLYVMQFRNSPFLLFLMVVFLGELFFLANFANAYGMRQETVTNSRLFSGPSLLPALHILFVLWQRLPFRAFTAGAVIAQHGGGRLHGRTCRAGRRRRLWRYRFIVRVTDAADRAQPAVDRIAVQLSRRDCHGGRIRHRVDPRAR